MSFVICDLCDDNVDLVFVVIGFNWFSYGGCSVFGGEIVMVKCFEDNFCVKEYLGIDGKGKVLVVDGGGSLCNVLIGDMIVENVVKNGWEGVIIYGVCCDVDELVKLDIGVLFFGCVLIKLVCWDEGQLNIDIIFGGVMFCLGEFVYVDNNGVIIVFKVLF